MVAQYIRRRLQNLEYFMAKVTMTYSPKPKYAHRNAYTLEYGESYVGWFSADVMTGQGTYDIGHKGDSICRSME